MRRWVVWFPVVAVGVAGLGALMWWLLWEVAPSLYPEDDLTRYSVETARVQAANGRLQAIATTRAAMVAGLAGLAAVGAAMINALNVRVGQHTLEATRETLALEREGHITERYTRAIDQLGTPGDAVAIRLGGLYALERIAVDSQRDHPTVVEVLSAYVRERAQEARSQTHEEEEWTDPPVVEVQAALDVLGRLPARGGTPRGDLTGAHLEGARLAGADLHGAQLNGAHLEGAQLEGAHLEGAYLERAHLEGAHLNGSRLEGAQLEGAHLEGAYLERAHLEDAQLSWAHLEDARLTGAHLDRARLFEAFLGGASLAQASCKQAVLVQAKLKNVIMVGASLQGAWLEGARLNGALLRRANLQGAQLQSAELDGAMLDEAHLEGASLHGAYLNGARFGTAQGMTQEQINEAHGDDATILPEGLSRPGQWSTSERE